MTLRKLTRKIARIFFAAGTAAAAAGPVYAKDVFIEWKPITGAIDYELEVQRDGKSVVSERTNGSKWSGDLAPGMYSYHLRAYDKLKRAGLWSDFKALVVMPGSPKPAFPRDGDKVFQFERGGPFKLKWNPVEGATSYKVEVKRGQKTVFSKVVNGTRISVPNLPAGEYAWQVSTFVEAGGRAPSSFTGKSWQSEIQEVESFKVERRELTAPEVLFPKGRVNPPPGGTLVFKWKAIEGAEGYEIRIYKGHRGPASQEGKARAFFVEDRQVALRVPNEGEFTWEVRALANVETDKSGKKAPESVGPKTVSEFKLDPNPSFTAGEGYLALSTMVAPYSYRIISPATGVEGSFASKAVTIRLSGEYYVSERWGVGMAFEQTKFTVLNEGLSRNGAEATARYRMSLSDSRYGFVLMPKFGLEMRQYPETRPSDVSKQSFTLFNPTAFGALIGCDLRRMFSEEFSLGIRLNFFYPLSLSGAEGSLGGGANMRNMNAGIQGLYWLSRDWGIGAGAFIDMRSISYQAGGAAAASSSSGTGNAQEIYMDGMYFFGSLIYNFGR